MIASVASATAAAVTSQLWIAGTWIAAALTPVLVALISEAMHRPTERIARAWTADRAARPARVTPTPAAAPEPPPRTRRGRRPTGAPGPVRVYRQPATGARRRAAADRARRRGRHRGIAFVIAVVTLTAGDLVSGGSVGKGYRPTTLRRRPSAKQADRRRRTRATAAADDPEQQTTPSTAPDGARRRPAQPPRTPHRPPAARNPAGRAGRAAEPVGAPKTGATLSSGGEGGERAEPADQREGGGGLPVEPPAHVRPSRGRRSGGRYRRRPSLWSPAAWLARSLPSGRCGQTSMRPCCAMAITHAHTHVHTDDARRLTIALVLILGLMAVEVVAGLLADSLALLSDAAHMLTDAGAIALALFAARLAQPPAEGGFTFGFRRAEILSAQLNGATLVALGAGDRRSRASAGSSTRPTSRALVVLVVALVGIVVNLAATRGARRRRAPQPQRRGRLPARAHRPVRLHRHGHRRRRGPASPASRARTASPRWSWRR